MVEGVGIDACYSDGMTAAAINIFMMVTAVMLNSSMVSTTTAMIHPDHTKKKQKYCMMTIILMPMTEVMMTTM